MSRNFSILEHFCWYENAGKKLSERGSVDLQWGKVNPTPLLNIQEVRGRSFKSWYQYQVGLVAGPTVNDYIKEFGTPTVDITVSVPEGSDRDAYGLLRSQIEFFSFDQRPRKARDLYDLLYGGQQTEKLVRDIQAMSKRFRRLPLNTQKLEAIEYDSKANHNMVVFVNGLPINGFELDSISSGILNRGLFEFLMIITQGLIGSESGDKLDIESINIDTKLADMSVTPEAAKDAMRLYQSALESFRLHSKIKNNLFEGYKKGETDIKDVRDQADFVERLRKDLQAARNNYSLISKLSLE